MKEKKEIIVLAIESSCDETAVALVANGRKILSNRIASQIPIHRLYGGVVPEVASRHHLENINLVVEEALDEAGLTMEQVDVIGVTQGPGLVGALLIGIATAKAFALVSGKPLVGVHHIQGHISANYLEYPRLKPPFMALILSGGHSHIAYVKSYNETEVLGTTRDDAIGEAYDKVARILGLPYPGGPHLDQLAAKGNPKAVEFKRVYLEKGSYDFSFSGIKTGVLNYVNGQKQKGLDICREDVAAGFQQAVLEVVVAKALQAVGEYNQEKLVVAGGVAANSRLRVMLKDACEKEGIQWYIPSPSLCTDNGAMIGSAAYYAYQAGRVDDLTMDAIANLPL